MGASLQQRLAAAAAEAGLLERDLGAALDDATALRSKLATREARIAELEARGSRPRRALPNSDQRLHCWGNLFPRHVDAARAAGKLELVDAPFVMDAGCYAGESPGVVEDFKQFLRPRAHWELNNAVGRYIAWTSTKNERPTWPPKWFDALLLERQAAVLNSLWGLQPERWNFTVRTRAVADRLAEWLVGTTLALSETHTCIRIDNGTLDYWVVAPPELTPEQHIAAQALLLECVGTLAHAAGLSVIVNNAYASEPSATYAKYAAWVDGWVREKWLQAGFRKPEHQNTLETYMAGDRRTLDAGKLLMLIPDATFGPTATAADNELAAGYAMLIREPGDKLFVGGLSYPGYLEEWPYAWAFWPRDLGPATDKYVRTGNVFTRRFERGVLSVDFVAGTVRVGP